MQMDSCDTELGNWKGIVSESKKAFLTTNERKIEIVRLFLESIGEDPDREGLMETPARVVKSWIEIFEGYHFNEEAILNLLSTSFGDVNSYNEMIVCDHIPFFSFCEHHMLPFTGVAHFAYVPKDRVIGLSKIPRLIDVYSKRLQIQERMTTQIVDAFMKYVDPKGCAVVIQGEHSCVSCRGVRKNGSSMKTSALRGCFLTHSETRAEFLNLIRMNKS